MKSFLGTASSAIVLFAALTGTAFANMDLPEPGTLGLAGLGIAAAVYILRKSKRGK